MIDSMALSICNWLASISSWLTAPVLAASTTRPLTELSRSATSAKYPSVVAMTEMARSELEIAFASPWISARSRSDTINPAGSSAPLLMRRPVDSRSSRTARSEWERARLFWAISDAMFVLILVMAILRDCD